VQANFIRKSDWPTCRKIGKKSLKEEYFYTFTDLFRCHKIVQNDRRW
jgi:hypothetical protein